MDMTVRYRLCFLAVASAVCAQAQPPREITVQPGKQGELVLMGLRPRRADTIDILASNVEGLLSIIFPDGRELTGNDTRPDGDDTRPDALEWAYLPEADRQSLDKGVQEFFVRGPGTHLIAAFRDTPQSGDYRIRLDARKANAAIHLTVKFISITDVVEASLRKIPGVKITSSSRVPGSVDGRATLSLSRTSTASMIDVVPLESHTTIRLRFPDGTVVTQGTAKAHGVEWSLMKWPPEGSGDPFGDMFADMYLFSMMLPVEGTHQFIYFANGLPQNGNYVIEAIAPRNRSTEVRAMFVPVDTIEKQVTKEIDELVHPPLKSR